MSEINIPKIPTGAKLPHPQECYCHNCVPRENILEDENGAFEGYQIKDSGERRQFSTGMQRDTNTDKPRYDLIWKEGLKRLAIHMAKGANKYTARNWEKAATQEEMDRFDESLLRHTFQLLEGDRSEDHMSAIVFNAFGREFVREKLK